MLFDFEEKKKKPFLALKKTEFFLVQKIKKSYFFKGVNPCFWTKNAKFFLHLDLVKIRLEITPRNNCVEEKNLF